jgi:hypothetical protein
LTDEQLKALEQLKVRRFSTDLRRFTLDQIRAEFAAPTSGRVLLIPLIRNIVYQAATRMIDGAAPKVEGNLRSLYYQWVKPVLARIPEAQEAKSDPYNETLNALETFIVQLRLFHYRDLELVDENWENRWYTDGRNPHLMVFAEKNGFVMFLQQVSRQYGLTSVALGGSPSHLSSEYLVEQLRKRIGAVEPLALFGVADYDPSGAVIGRCFREQLENQGVEVSACFDLIEPSAYSAEELELFRFPIPSKYPARIKNWRKEKGGIGGIGVNLSFKSSEKPIK